MFTEEIGERSDTQPRLSAPASSRPVVDSLLGQRHATAQPTQDIPEYSGHLNRPMVRNGRGSVCDRRDSSLGNAMCVLLRLPNEDGLSVHCLGWNANQLEYVFCRYETGMPYQSVMRVSSIMQSPTDPYQSESILCLTGT